jgi:hypothetical protein
MKYYTTTTEYNCGIDLHTRQMYICVMDRNGQVLVHRNIKNNDIGFFLKLVAPYRHDPTVTCESCFVCFWLADACEDAGIMGYKSIKDFIQQKEEILLAGS